MPGSSHAWMHAVRPWCSRTGLVGPGHNHWRSLQHAGGSETGLMLQRASLQLPAAGPQDPAPWDTLLAALANTVGHCC